MYIYHKTYQKTSHICECENRSLLLKGCHRGQKSVLTELDWANPCQSSETAGFWGRMAMILPRGGATCCALTYIKDRYMKPRLRLDGVGGGVPGDSSVAEIGFVGHVA